MPLASGAVYSTNSKPSEPRGLMVWEREEEEVLRTNKGPITPLDILYGFRPFLAANPFMAHRFGWTAQTLEKALREAGFTYVTVERDFEFNLWAVASPTAV